MFLLLLTLTSAEYCMLNKSCGPNNNCLDPISGLNGICCNGSTCVQNQTVSATQACDVNCGLQCPTGYYCASSACQILKGPLCSCSLDSDCLLGFCNSNTCATPLLLNNESCAINADCFSGNCTNSSCQALLINATCDNTFTINGMSLQCDASLFCRRNGTSTETRCVSACPTNLTGCCNSKSDCASPTDSCTSKTCSPLCDFNVTGCCQTTSQCADSMDDYCDSTTKTCLLRPDLGQSCSAVTCLYPNNLTCAANCTGTCGNTKICQLNGTLAAGDVCDQTATPLSQCAAGLVCQRVGFASYTCQALGGVKCGFGAACGNGTICAISCTNTSCSPYLESCQQPESIMMDYPCAIDLQCASGICAANCSNTSCPQASTCQANMSYADGHACLASRQCINGHCDYNCSMTGCVQTFVCQSPLPLGNPCRDSAQCGSGFCQANCSATNCSTVLVCQMPNALTTASPCAVQAQCGNNLLCMQNCSLSSCIAPLTCQANMSLGPDSACPSSLPTACQATLFCALNGSSQAYKNGSPSCMRKAVVANGGNCSITTLACNTQNAYVLASQECADPTASCRHLGAISTLTNGGSSGCSNPNVYMCQPPTNNWTCTGNSDCPDASVCSSRICVTQIGVACTSNTSGFCKGNNVIMGCNCSGNCVVLATSLAPTSMPTSPTSPAPTVACVMPTVSGYSAQFTGKAPIAQISVALALLSQQNASVKTSWLTYYCCTNCKATVAFLDYEVGWKINCQDNTLTRAVPSMCANATSATLAAAHALLTSCAAFLPPTMHLSAGSSIGPGFLFLCVLGRFMLQ